MQSDFQAKFQINSIVDDRNRIKNIVHANIFNFSYFIVEKRFIQSKESETERETQECIDPV